MCFITLFILSFQYLCAAQQIRDKNIKKEKYVPDEIIVKFKDGVSQKERERVYKLLNAVKIREGYKAHYHVLTIGKGKVIEFLKKCEKYNEIEYAEPNHLYYTNAAPNDEFYSYQWHFPLIHHKEALEFSTGEGVTVAVIDTGVAPNGPDGFGSRLILGKNFVKRNSDPIDDNGHGTHVAGTIAQETNNGIGVAGVAPNATILVIKVLNEFASGPADQVADGIRWATDNAANVINLSLGGSEFNKTMFRAVNYALKHNVVLVAAAGNAGIPVVSFPAGYEGVIAVGAVQFDKKRADYSNGGPDIDVMAPGGNTFKDQNDDNNSDGVLQETLFTDVLKGPGSIWNYYFLNGTSMATPHVSGIAALLLSLNPSLTPDQIRTIITETAEDIGEPGFDNETGWGLVNAEDAVKSVIN